MRKNGLLVLLALTPLSFLSSCGGKNYDAFVKECQQGIYEDFSGREAGTLDAEGINEMAKRVTETDGYLSLQYRMAAGVRPQVIPCRKIHGKVFVHNGFYDWVLKTGDRRMKFSNWEAAADYAKNGE